VLKPGDRKGRPYSGQCWRTPLARALQRYDFGRCSNPFRLAEASAGPSAGFAVLLPTISPRRRLWYHGLPGGGAV